MGTPGHPAELTATKGRAEMDDVGCASFQSQELRTEYGMCTALGIASAASERALTHDDVDQLLGVRASSLA